MPKGKQRTLEQWHALFELHQSSELSAAEFCRRNNISIKTFGARKALWKTQEKASAFLKVETQTPKVIIETSPPEIQFSIGMLQLTLPADTKPYWIGQLLKGYQS